MYEIRINAGLGLASCVHTYAVRRQSDIPLNSMRAFS